MRTKQARVHSAPSHFYRGRFTILLLAVFVAIIAFADISDEFFRYCEISKIK